MSAESFSESETWQLKSAIYYLKNDLYKKLHSVQRRKAKLEYEERQLKEFLFLMERVKVNDNKKADK